MRKSSLIKRLPNSRAVLFEVRNRIKYRNKDKKPHLFYFWKQSKMDRTVSICVSGNGMAEIIITRDALIQMLAEVEKNK